MTDRNGGGDRKRRRRPPRGQPGRPGATGRRHAQLDGRPPKGRAALELRRLEDGAYVLVHPRCVEQRREDYEEALEIWRAGEPEEARDALRFALEGCGDNLWVHVALGRLALEHDRDPLLARGHFGYAFELARAAIPPGFAGRLPRRLPANGPLYEAIDGLIACLQTQNQHGEVAELRRLAAAWGGDLPAGGKPGR